MIATKNIIKPIINPLRFFHLLFLSLAFTTIKQQRQLKINELSTPAKIT